MVTNTELTMTKFASINGVRHHSVEARVGQINKVYPLGGITNVVKPTSWQQHYDNPPHENTQKITYVGLQPSLPCCILV